MSKKNFTGGLSSLLGDQPEVAETVAKTITKTKEIPAISQVTKDVAKEVSKETRATFIINETLLEKLKAIAYWDRLLLKEIISSALSDTITKYEKKNGELKPIPKKQKMI